MAAEPICCKDCPENKNKYYSIADDSGPWLCGETCIRNVSNLSLSNPSHTTHTHILFTLNLHPNNTNQHHITHSFFIRSFIFSRRILRRARGRTLPVPTLDTRCTNKLSLTVVEVCIVRWICTHAIALRAVLILVMIRCPRRKPFEPGTRKPRPTTHSRSADTSMTSARKRSDARRTNRVRAISFRTTTVPHRRE